MGSKNTTPENLIEENIVILDLRSMEHKRIVVRPYNSRYLDIMNHVLVTRYEIFCLSISILDKKMTMSLKYFIAPVSDIVYYALDSYS